jgi:hypothetical protein
MDRTDGARLPRRVADPLVQGHAVELRAEFAGLLQQQADMPVITLLEGSWARLESFSGRGYRQAIGW